VPLPRREPTRADPSPRRSHHDELKRRVRREVLDPLQPRPPLRLPVDRPERAEIGSFPNEDGRIATAVRQSIRSRVRRGRSTPWVDIRRVECGQFPWKGHLVVGLQGAERLARDGGS
jgi:hypothetical protein